MRVKSITWKMDKARPGKHTLRLYYTLSTEVAYILLQAHTDHRRLNTCLHRKPTDCPGYQYERSVETVLHMLLHCERYAVARKALQKSAGEGGKLLSLNETRNTLLSGIISIHRYNGTETMPSLYFEHPVDH